MRALWRGTQPTVIRLAFGAGLHFFFLETIKPLFERRQGDGAASISAMGAMVTGGRAAWAGGRTCCCHVKPSQPGWWAAGPVQGGATWPPPAARAGQLLGVAQWRGARRSVLWQRRARGGASRGHAKGGRRRVDKTPPTHTSPPPPPPPLPPAFPTPNEPPEGLGS